MARNSLAAAFLIALSLMATGCGDAPSSVTSPAAKSSAEKSPVQESGSPLGVQLAAQRQVPTDLTLPESQREYLWELEHHSNVLNQHGFKRIGAQLKARDAAALKSHLASDFEGQLLDTGASNPDSPKPSSTDSVPPNSVESVSVPPLRYGASTLNAERFVEATHPLRPATADEFVAWLVSLAEPYAEILGTQFGVKRIGPVREGEVDGPWWVWCTLRLWGKTPEGGQRETTIVLSLTMERPEEERLAQPGWLQTAKVLQAGHSTTPRFLFRDVTKETGLDVESLYENWNTEDKLQLTGGIYATDFDQDGLVDLLITDEGKNLETLYRGTREGKFENVTSRMGLEDATLLPRTSICAAFVDLDGDGWDDLITGDGVIRKNDGGKQFVDVTGRSNFALTALVGQPRFGPAICGIIPADFDRDGKLDLYLTRIGTKPTSWLLETNTTYLPNQLLRNVGDWRFEDVTRKFGVDGEGRSCFSAAWLDANNDLWPDLYVINEFGDGVLYVNEQGKGFQTQDVEDQVSDFGSMGLAAGDIDNDGNIELYVAAMYSKAGSRIIGNLPDSTYDPAVMRRLRSLVDGSELYRNEGNLKFRASGQDDLVHDAGWAWGPLFADFDNDGWLDLYATAGYMSRDRAKPDG